MARPRSVSDEQILEVSKRCFLKHGPSVSTQVIADELGISQPALFRRFGTKEELLMAALGPKVPPFIEDIEAGPTAEAFEPQLRSLLKSIGDFFWEMIPCISVLRSAGIHSFDQMLHHEDPPPIRTHKSLIAWLTRARALGHIEIEDFDIVATMMLGSLQMRPFLDHLDKSYLTDTTREQYLLGLERNLLRLFRASQAPSTETK